LGGEAPGLVELLLRRHLHRRAALRVGAGAGGQAGGLGALLLLFAAGGGRLERDGAAQRGGQLGHLQAHRTELARRREREGEAAQPGRRALGLRRRLLLAREDAARRRHLRRRAAHHGVGGAVGFVLGGVGGGRHLQLVLRRVAAAALLHGVRD